MCAKSCNMSFDYLKTFYLWLKTTECVIGIRHGVEKVSNQKKNVRSESQIQPEQKPFLDTISICFEKRETD